MNFCPSSAYIESAVDVMLLDSIHPSYSRFALIRLHNIEPNFALFSLKPSNFPL